MVKRQPIEADEYPMKLMVTNTTDVLPMVTDVYLRSESGRIVIAFGQSPSVSGLKTVMD
jgi:hypothetical protein